VNQRPTRCCEWARKVAFIACMVVGANAVFAQGAIAPLLPEQQQIQIDPVVALATAAAQGNLNEVDRLLKTGLGADVTNPQRKTTALHGAAANGHVRVVARLVAAGADPLREDVFGVTPLVNAAYGGHIAAARALLEKAGTTALVSPRSNRSVTALNAAILGGHRAMVEFLLSSGAPIDARDAFGFNAIDTASRAKRADVVDLLTKAMQRSATTAPEVKTP